MLQDKKSPNCPDLVRSRRRATAPKKDASRLPVEVALSFGGFRLALIVNCQLDEKPDTLVP